jgi:benzoyl-CoA reductase/2-hydroxyglutaryl-CoA dehydratase subunit BcrC/BadD/HgdB
MTQPSNPGGKGEDPLAALQAVIAREKQAFIDAKDGRKKIGYLCNYAPQELFNAAGVRHVRLFKGGDTDVVSIGERFTQSVFCDFTKACLGSFSGNDPLYKALDRVYAAHSCNTIKRVSEIINQFVPVKLLSLPKLRALQSSRDFFHEEFIDLRKDLEKLTGNKITDEAIQENIVLYNKLRHILKKISELRKRANPPITGAEYLDLVTGFYYIDPKLALPLYEDLYAKLAAKESALTGERPLRLMMAGSVVADGDRRMLDILEGELGSRVVVEAHCTGVRPFLHSLRENGDPLRALSDGYLDQAPCAKMRPLSDSSESAGRLAQEYSVDGIIYVYLKFCICYGVGTKEFMTHFQKIGIPALEVSSDYSESDHGQIKTRVEAFIEMLNERKDNLDEQYIGA